jgi:DNA-binding transcriptional LysR family regulator
MQFRMNDLENFLEVAKCKTMSEASQKLGITQPALSESIKRLELDLKGILFYRSRSGTKLTPTGNAVLKHAKNAFSFLSSIETIQDNSTHFGLKTITIGCHSTVASYFLPNALQHLEKSAPDYKITLKHELSRNILTEIQQGMIDVGIVVNPTHSPDLVIRKLGKDEVAVWSSGKRNNNKIFCNPDLIQTQSILRKWKTRPSHIVGTSSLELIVRLTQAGLGFGIIPTRAVELLGAHLTKVDSAPVYLDSICIVSRPEFGKSPQEREVIQSLLQNQN